MTCDLTRVGTVLFFSLNLVLGCDTDRLSKESPCPEGTQRVIDEGPPQTWWCARPDGAKHGPAGGRFASGQVHLKAQYADNRETGTWTRWFPNGQQMMQIRHGDQPGNRRGEFWYDNGQKREIAEMQQGVYHGAYQGWYKNGQTRVSGKFVKGKMHGEWDFWYEDGTQGGKGTFSEGTIDGIWREWSSSGRLRAKGACRQGHRIGKWTLATQGRASTSAQYAFGGIQTPCASVDQYDREDWGLQ